ncbi:MAG: DedA family protein [Gemmatimonadota bacterium]
MIEQFLTWLAGLPGAEIYGFIAVLAGLENIVPLVPADTAVALGAFLSTRGADLTPFGVYVATLVPNVISAAGVYALGQTAGRSFFATRMGRKLVSERAMRTITRLYERHHYWGIFISRFLPGYRAVVPPFAAIVGIPMWKAMPMVALASGLYYAILVLLAYHVGRNWDAVRHAVGGLSAWLAVAALLVTAVVGYLAWRHRRHLKADAD